MNLGLLVVSATSILFAIIALGIGAYTASVFSTSSTQTTASIGQSFGVWWGAFPIILTGAIGIATALQDTVRENPGYILAVFTAVMAFCSFIIAVACMIYVGVITLFLFVASSLTNNVDVTNLYRSFAAGEAFIVFSTIMMLVLFIYACILTCVKCCPECCGEGGCAGCEKCDEQHDTEAAGCASCDCDCDDKPPKSTTKLPDTIVIGSDAPPRTPSYQINPPRTPSYQIGNPSPPLSSIVVGSSPRTNVSVQQPYAPMQGNLQPASIQMPSLSVTKPSIGGSTAGLPAGWIAHYDPATGNTYYENTLNNTTTWDKPTEKGAMPEIRA